MGTNQQGQQGQTTTPPTKEPSTILAFFAQPVVTVVIQASYMNGKIVWQSVVGQVIDRDASGLLIRDAAGHDRFLSWSIVVSVRSGTLTPGDW